MTTALLWFRRDLRLAAQPALTRALAECERVLPVYVLDEEAEAPWAPGAASRWWLHRSLAALAGRLAARGAPLVLRRGPSLDVLRELAAAVGARAVYWNRAYEPAATARDRQVAAGLREAGIAVHELGEPFGVEPGTLRTADGRPYRVFTPFWKALRPRLDPPGRLEPEPDAIPAPPAPASTPLEALGLLPRPRWDAGLAARWTPGEDGAHEQLQRFVEASLAAYVQGRDRPDRQDTSQLSPHLHFGELTPAQVQQRLLRACAAEPVVGTLSGAEGLLRELGWREFGRHLLQVFPETPTQPLDERFERFAWRRPQAYAGDLAAWQRGRTGLPIVDAGMRELWATGWMHNRVRMIVASVLTKNLLIPWQEGARWFWDTLVDADLANNTLGWQWTAGCGADAAPYFRIFNPVTQARRFDPAGQYIGRWLPELASLPAAERAWPDAEARAACGYPWPIVDLAQTRQRALAAYSAMRGDARPVPAEAPLL